MKLGSRELGLLAAAAAAIAVAWLLFDVDGAPDDASPTADVTARPSPASIDRKAVELAPRAEPRGAREAAAEAIASAFAGESEESTDTYSRFSIRIVVEFEDRAFDPGKDWDWNVDVSTRAPILRPVVTFEPPPQPLPFSRADDDPLAGSAWHIVGATELSEPGRFAEEHRIEVRRRLPVHASVAVGDRVLQTRRIEAEDEKAVFVIQARDLDEALGSARFHVVGENGEPPDCFFVCYLLRAPDSPVSCSVAYSSGVREARLERLIPGPLGIEVRAQDHATIRLEILVEPGVDRDLGEIRLQPELSIKGRILGPDGGPMMAKGFQLECIPVPDVLPDASVFGPRKFRCGTDGSFTILGLARGRYAVRAWDGAPFEMASGPVEVSTELGSVDGVELLMRYTTEVEIELPDSLPKDCKVLVEDSAGLPADEGSADEGSTIGFRLPPGRYRALARIPGSVIRTVEFEAVAPRTQVSLGPR